MRKSLVNLVPFVVTYLIYDAPEKEHNRLDRKMPGQYALPSRIARIYLPRLSDQPSL